MGRISTGIEKTASVCRIDMRDLTRWGVLKHNSCSFSMEWTDGSSIWLEVNSSKDGKYIVIEYKLTDFQGDSYNMKYTISLDRIPSNLGRGYIYYFICPKTGKRCRVLYRAYGSYIFRSRDSYPYRLYYPIQTESKNNRKFERVHSIKAKLDKLNVGRKRKQDYFKGKRTKYSFKKKAYMERFVKLDEECQIFIMQNIIKHL
jgi:hypothetical protein